MRQKCIMSPLALHCIYINAVVKEMKMENREKRTEISGGRERVEIA